VKKRYRLFELTREMMDSRHVHQGPSSSVLMPILQKNCDRSAQQLESFVELALPSAQGSLEVEVNRPLDRVARPALQMDLRLLESLFRTSQIRPDAP